MQGRADWDEDVIRRLHLLPDAFRERIYYALCKLTDGDVGEIAEMAKVIRIADRRGHEK